MLKTIRSLSTKSDFAGASRMAIAMRFAGKIVFVLYLGLFISDTINIDVLSAALKGDVTFVDDPYISDSLFDIGPQHLCSAFDVPFHSNIHQEFTSKDHRRIADDNLVKNVITEDEDSPGIADAILSSSFAEHSELPRPQSEAEIDSTIPSLDRTISYQRILI
ncbi:MAG: hypothetical protein ACHQM6_03635 [Candidatus Kapaibacterium sp.]